MRRQRRRLRESVHPAYEQAIGRSIQKIFDLRIRPYETELGIQLRSQRDSGLAIQATSLLNSNQRLARRRTADQKKNNRAQGDRFEIHPPQFNTNGPPGNP